MQAVKQKKTFKETVKDTGSKAKAYAKKQGEKVKNYGKKYGADIRSAYDLGYARGWDDAYDIPKRFGAKTAAAYGYKKGVKNRVKSDKYIKQYMARICRKIGFAILSFVLSLWVVMAGFFSAVLPSISAKASTVLTYEQTSVMDDLKESTIDGEPFSLTEYGFNAFKDTQVLSLVEYCYSFYRNMQDNYGLYLYLYNPKGLNFDVNHALNTVQLYVPEGEMVGDIVII